MELTPEQQEMMRLVTTEMPFGKYRGTPLVDLPEPYVVWFYQKGFPEGKLGEMLALVYEIKVNGLEYLFAPLKKLAYRNNHFPGQGFPQ